MTTLQVFRRAVRPLVAAVVTVGTTATALLVVATAASAGDTGNGYEEAAQPGVGLTVTETLLLYVAAPALIFGLIALVVVGPSLGKGARHRTGAALETGPVWIDASGAQHTPASTARPNAPGATDQGGTSAHW